MKVILSGGGTLGSVSPLLAVAEELRKMDSEMEFLWFGTKNGPERPLVEEMHIPLKSIAAGKLRRYFDLRNIIDLFKIDIGFWQSFFILRKFLHQPSRHSEGAERPRNLAGARRATRSKTIFVSAGGFVSVPAALAAYILKIPILIHQQDVVPGLANKLMSAMAKKITVSLDISLGKFSGRKTELIGNPVRSFIFSGDKEKVFQRFNLKKDLPTLLVVGGGSGAQAINELVEKSLPELVKFCQIIHLTGKGKMSSRAERSGVEGSHTNRDSYEISRYARNDDMMTRENYHQIEFVTSEIPDFYAAADLIISRAGMSALSEICALGKPAIIIPIPNSHQEKNAEYFASRGAVKLFKQSNMKTSDVLRTSDVNSFVNLVKELLFNQPEREKLSENAKKIMPRDAGQKLAEIIKSPCHSPACPHTNPATSRKDFY